LILVRYNRSGVHTALLQVELSLQRPQHFIINLSLIPQPDQRLSFRLKHCQNRITSTHLIDQLLHTLLSFRWYRI